MGLWPTSEACWAGIAVCLLAFLGAALLSYVIPLKLPKAIQAVFDIVVLGSGLLLANTWRVSTGVMLPAVDTWIRAHSGVLDVPFILLAAVLLLRWRRRLAHLFYLLLLMLSPFLLVTMGRAVAVATGTDFRALNRVQPPLRLGAARPGMRVVVVIFDEMDFNYAFTSRPRTLALPTFDTLRVHSFFAADAHAPATSTQLSVPSYLIGEALDSIVSTKPGKEIVTLIGDERRRDIFTASTLFDDAFKLGARSEVVGFHIPYCRWAFARRLERCTWRPISQGGVLDGPIGLPHAVLRQFLSILMLGNREAHIDRIRFLSAAAVRASPDSALRLVFLHLPIPHFPPVWDERSGHFTVFRFRSSGYFDNLALADHILARIMDATRQAGLDDRTVFLVTSDHPWRSGPIEGLAPGHTVPFIVRFPDGVGLEWAPRFETVRIRSLVRALLSGEIRSGTGLAKWAIQPPSLAQN